ncbi:Choline/Carnitine o-acyltransferase-domain-containing protein [Flammula alnicola]|nr:Choline/Carnitine o-acyltransferase-domain-containing protein [Flammula alnicola]
MFQAAYFGLYGRIECVYEPAMTKAFLHGRTEAVRSIQPEIVNFTKKSERKKLIVVMRKACEKHVKLTRDCSQGLGQDRHLYAIYCLIQWQMQNKYESEPNGIASPSPSPPPHSYKMNKMPTIFTEPRTRLGATGHIYPIYVELQ